MKRTAIFGGSFNPIHKGHLGIAKAIIDAGVTDELWLMVSPQNPLKHQNDLLPENCRLQMAKAAVKDMERVEASDFEFHLPRPSYTWNTMNELELAYPECQFSLVIGADNWYVFHKWAHHIELLEKYPLIIYPREGYPIDTKTLPKSAILIDAPLFPWSSSQIREALKKGDIVNNMLSPETLQIIRANQYYAE